MIKRMVIALAGLLALFALAAAPASAAPAAASPDNTIMTLNQWTAYSGQGWAGAATQVAHNTNCAPIPSGNTFSAVNGADSTFDVQIFSASGCNAVDLVADVPKGNTDTWATAGTFYSSTSNP